MSLILQPQRAFPIVRQIANHTDTGTYYVRAVVRDADGSLLSNVDLVDKGSQRFQTAWAVVADPSGMGRYISIITSVYTDSGYTTKSPNYGDEENTYLVFDRVLPSQRGGGGMSARDVRRVIKEELELAKPDPIKFPEAPEQKVYEMRWDELLLAMEVVRQAVIKVPTEATDTAPLVAKMDALASAIEEKEVTPVTDLTPVLERLTDDKDDTEVSQEDVRSRLDEIEENILKTMPVEINKAIAGTKFVSQFNTFAAPNQEVKQEEKESVFNIKDISK